jgi:hypothetical protein
MAFLGPIALSGSFHLDLGLPLALSLPLIVPCHGLPLGLDLGLPLALSLPALSSYRPVLDLLFFLVEPVPCPKIFYKKIAKGLALLTIKCNKRLSGHLFRSALLGWLFLIVT